MRTELLQSVKKHSILDPRTKLLLLILMGIFVTGHAGGAFMYPFIIVMTILPFVLLLTEKQYKFCLTGGILLAASILIQILLVPYLSGVALSLTFMITSLVIRFTPGLMMGVYAMASTTVSEFVAAMQKMRITDKIIIPMSVMFRFFPTVGNEFFTINSAMKMRDIRFGGTKALKMIEYRIIPMLTCSVKIGEELSAAALTRGLGGTKKRTNICFLKMTVWDILVYIFTIILFGWLIYNLWRLR